MKLSVFYYGNGMITSNLRSVLVGVILSGIFFGGGKTAPRRDPLRWNFLMKKETLPTLPAPRWEKDDLRIPPVDFLLPKPTSAQSKHSTRYREYSEEDYDSREEYVPESKRRPKPRPQKAQPWLKSTLSTSKRAIVNYVKAVKKMFKPEGGEEQVTHLVPQDRGDTRVVAQTRPLRAQKYATNLELGPGNRVKSVAMIVPQGGDPFTETGYLKEGGAGSEDFNLGIGEAISDLFWGSVYGAQS